MRQDASVDIAVIPISEEVEDQLGAYLDYQSGVGRGRAYVFAGNDLFLEASANQPNAGDAVEFDWHTRDPSVLSAIVAIQVGSAPQFTIIDLGASDTFGDRSLIGTVPTGLSGLTIEVEAFALDSIKGTVSSSVQELTFL